MVRRDVLKSIGLALAGAGLLAVHARPASAAGAKTRSAAANASRGECIVTSDGTSLFYKDWGQGKPVVFISNWATNCDMWQYQMTPLSGGERLRCVAYDRRGNGRSSQPGKGYDFDTLSDDLAALIDQLDLHEVTLVGHSMGGGEIVRYLSRHGASRIHRVVLIAPVTPFLLKTAGNPGGIDKSAFDQMREAWSTDFPKWLADNTLPYFSPQPSAAMMQWVANLCLQCSLKAAIECSHAWSETDFRAELAKIRVPALVIQGDKDTLPIDLTGRKTAAMIRGCQFKIYEGAAHGLMFTHIERLNGDLIAFIQS